VRFVSGAIAKLTATIAALACLLSAQAPAPPEAKSPDKLTYTGTPLKVPFQCTNEDMDWAGMSCTEDEPCPVYLELAAVESVGSRLFVAGNIHSSAVTLYSVLLASEDGGRTWSEPYDRIRGVELDHIQFIDFENGWISGQVLVPVPQDPFLLITSDSGKTWRRRPIFGENRAGTISQFRFTSRTSGSLVIDRSQSGDDSRYELYESMTGGESWMLRETNDKPLKLKQVFTPNTDWRLHADAASKAFRVEKRQGEKWNALASFLVPFGVCKPVPAPQQPEAEPPAEQPMPPAPASRPASPAKRSPKKK
jgi:hypothetical protein